MTILASDVTTLASVNMNDTPQGGGGPSGNKIPDGFSNTIFKDVTEAARAGGQVSIRQLFEFIDTLNADEFQDSNIIVSRPPNDTNVSITLAKCPPFAQRTEIAAAIENYLIKGSEWNGYLLENHVAGQRQIQLFQRPGTPSPPIGRTLVLIKSEGLGGEVSQFVRVTKVETEDRTYSYSTSGGIADYPATVVKCDISDALRADYPGSPPNRLYTRDNTKTIVRDTTVADAAVYYGATTLTAIAELGDIVGKVTSVYSQLVPSARTESIALDQKPGAQRLLTLALSPRVVQVGVTPHSLRTRVGQENRGFSWVEILRPFPAPGTVIVSYMALGNWYTVVDDGNGQLTGAGVGTVNYTNGSIALTLPSLPDVGSSIIFSWGERSAYDNRSALTTFRPPEYVWELPGKPIKANSVSISYLSGGVVKTVVDNASGVLSGDGTGQVNYATGKVYLKPTFMIDAGAEFVTDFIFTPTITENITAPAVDSGGFALLTLQESPAPGSLTLRWITTRTVSNSAGSSEVVTQAASGSTKVTTSQIPKNLGGVRASAQSVAPGGTVAFSYGTINDGVYTYDIVDDTGSPSSPPVTGGSDTGTFTVTGGTGSFNVGVDAGTAVRKLFGVRIFNASLVQVAQSSEYVFVLAVNPAPSVPNTLPQSAAQTRAETKPSMFAAGVNEAGVTVYVSVAPVAAEAGTTWTGTTYDPPANAAAVWSSADVAAGGKTLTSQRGTPTFYSIWGG